MKRAPRLALLSCVASLAVAPVAQADEGTLIPRGSVSFPARSFVLTLPDGAAPSPAAIRVRENGQPVDSLQVASADSRFAVLLAIDASASMRGRAIRGAMQAARAFAAQRPASQALGIITFNDDVEVVLPPTTNATAIDQVLRRPPPLRPDTHMYDAVTVAVDQLRGDRYDGGAVVIVSDGDDYGSEASVADAASAVQRGSARLFTVGIESREFNPSALEELASTSERGEYLGSPSAAELAGVYRALGGQLANAYVVSYKSISPAGSRVRVVAGAGGEVASAEYQAPELRVPGADPAPRPSAASDPSFLGTTLGGSVVAAVVFVLLLGAMLALLTARSRAGSVRRRLAEYGSADPIASQTTLEEQRAPLRLAESWSARTEESLDIAQLNVTPLALAARVLAAALGVGLVLAALVGSPVPMILALLAAPLAGRAYVRRRIEEQRTAFAGQLADTIQAVVSSMRAGSGFVSALSQVGERAPQPTARELRRVVADEQLGMPLEQALDSLVQRMASRDVEQVALVSLLQRETGGNAADALDRVVENIRARDDLRRLVRTLIAQGRFAQRALSALPIGAVALLTLLNPDLMKPLFETGAGRVALILAALLVTAGTFWIRKLIDIRI